MRPTLIRRISMKQFFQTEGNMFSPYFAKEYFMFGFLGSMVFLSAHSLNEVKKAGPMELPPDVKEAKRKQMDPRRPPWPVLHQRVVFIREGKAPHDDIALLWEQTKHYYPADWLIPLELSQILKYTTGAFLQSYVANPEGMRHEIIDHLEAIADGRVKDTSGGRLNRDVQELITMAVEDLKALDLQASGFNLTPTHTK